jgi:hypothetical protein
MCRDGRLGLAPTRSPSALVLEWKDGYRDAMGMNILGRSGDPQTISDIADFFDLPPSLIKVKIKPLLRLDETADSSVVDRFLVERTLDMGLVKGASWAAASLGLKRDTFTSCIDCEDLEALPMPWGSLPRRQRSNSKEDERKIFNLDLLSDWATKLITQHLGHPITFSNVTSKALRLREALTAAGLKDAQVEFCSFESRHLDKLGIEASQEEERAVSSTLCAVTKEPIWEGYGCWLDNGKPLSLQPDLVSYEEVWQGSIVPALLNPTSYEHFRQLTQGWR